MRVFLINPARSTEERVVVEGFTTLSSPSMEDLRNERGRLNIGFGLVGIGGFGMGLPERECGVEERGELVHEKDFEGLDS